VLGDRVEVAVWPAVRIQHNWTDDVATFDKVYNQAMMMADALADGITKQFPTKA